MKSIGTSENYQNNNMKALIIDSKFLGPSFSFYQIKNRSQIISFLDTNIKIKKRTQVNDGLQFGMITLEELNTFSDEYITARIMRV